MNFASLSVLALQVVSCLAAAVPMPSQTLVLRADASTPTTASTQHSVTTAPVQYISSTEHITITGVTNDHVTIPAKTIDIVIPTCVRTIEPDENGYLPPGTCGALWAYYPSFNAAVAFASLFGLLTGVHIWQAALYKKPFCWVIIMAAMWETVAFTMRAASAKQQQNTGILLVFQGFILLAPLCKSHSA